MSNSNERERERECVCGGQLERLPVATSIDSLWLFFHDVVVAPDFARYANNYKITKSTAKKGRKVRQGMLWREGGEPVWGRSAVAKSGCFDFYLARINPCKPPQLTVKFSFPRSIWGHNACPVRQDEVATVIEAINKRAAQLGLTVDTARAQITRLDLFRDVMVEHTFDDYLEVLRAVEPPYGKRFEERDTWILRGTKPTRWAIYDKCAALVNQSKSQKDEEIRAGFLGLAACRQKLEQAGAIGLMRFEWRLLGAKKIREEIGLDDFDSWAMADDLLHKKFDHAIARDIFRWPLPDERAVEGWCDLQAQRERATTCAERLMLKRGRLETILALAGWNQWVLEFGLKRANEILKTAGNANERKLFKTLLCRHQHSTLMPCGLFWGQLYGELARAVFSSAMLEKLPPMIPLPKVSSKPKKVSPKPKTRARKQA